MLLFYLILVSNLLCNYSELIQEDRRAVDEILRKDTANFDNFELINLSRLPESSGSFRSSDRKILDGNNHGQLSGSTEIYMCREQFISAITLFIYRCRSARHQPASFQGIHGIRRPASTSTT